jgi:hypothetical protein
MQGQSNPFTTQLAVPTNVIDQDIGYMRKYRFPGEQDDQSTSMMLDQSEKQFLRYLVEMHSVLTGDRIDLSRFVDIVSALEYLKKVQEHEYFNTLARPERTRGSKIPTQIPIPSSSFQLKQSFYIQTNASGNATVIINPFYLTSTGSNTSTVFLNNAATLTGTSSDNNFNAIPIGQAIPNVYNQYRLVSGSVVAKYVGRLDTVQGLIGGAIIFDQNIVPTTVATVNASLAKYGDYNLAQDAYFQQENYSLQGMRELYFPLDNTWEQYQPLGTAKNGFGFLLYVLGAPPSSNVYKVDVYLNMECLPDVTFLNYIPTSISQASSEGKEEAIRAVQQAPISKESEMMQTSTSKGGFFDKIIETVGKVLPAIGDVAKVVGRIMA